MEIIRSYQKTAKHLKSGKVGIIPTDTIYGISCLASSKENIEKIYEIKGRDYTKPFIVLISRIENLKEFGISPSDKESEILSKYWPGPVSIILDIKDDKFHYLHRGKMSLAFRLPDDKKLIYILNKTGPLVSTSANISGLPTINGVMEAGEYFDKTLDFMLDIGPLSDRKPSRIIQIKNGVEVIIR